MPNAWQDELLEAARQRRAQWFLEQTASLPDSLVGRQGEILGIQISPVKSLGMLQLKEGAQIGPRGLCTPDGLFSDRAVMFVQRKPGQTDKGPYEYLRLSQRELNALVLAKPSIEQGKLFYPGPLELSEALMLNPEQLQPQEGEVVRIRTSLQSQEITTGVLEDGPMTKWVRSMATRYSRTIDWETVYAVVRDHAFYRPVEAMHACGQIASTDYTDGGEVTIASMSTLNAMNRSLASAAGRELSPESFRMNITLGGLPPCAEYFIGAIGIECGRDIIPLKFGGLCIRCVVTTVDPATGTIPNGQPLQWLAANFPPRPDKPNSTTFGVNCVFGFGSEGEIIKPKAKFTVISDKV